MPLMECSHCPTPTPIKKMGCKELCGGVHTGRHRHSHRHRFKWAANPFCPCLSQCRPVLTLHELWSASFSMNCATREGGRGQAYRNGASAYICTNGVVDYSASKNVPLKILIIGGPGHFRQLDSVVVIRRCHCCSHESCHKDHRPMPCWSHFLHL